MSDGSLVRYRNFIQDSARWEGFAFRPDDIVVSTPPKCGTTWTQQICGLLIFQSAALDRSLDEVSPWLDQLTRTREAVFDLFEAQTHRRFIKTHTPLDGLPFDDRVTYVCVGRDPRDVALSMDHHRANLDIDAVVAHLEAADALREASEVSLPTPSGETTERERFWRWVDDPSRPQDTGSSLHRTLHHLTTFWAVRDAPNVMLLHYDDLQRDLDGEMRGLAARLGIEVPEDRWPELVEAATFDRMREQADLVAPSTHHAIFHDHRAFFHRGTSGQWRELLDDDDLVRYDARVRQLAEPDLAAWVHREAPDRSDA